MKSRPHSLEDKKIKGKTDKLLARLIKKKRKRAQINKIRNEREVTNNTTEIQRNVRKYY